MSDDAITAVEDDRMVLEVEERYQHGEESATRVEEARAFERLLSARLHRWDCPPAAQLGDYHLGYLPADQKRAVAAHLSACVLCQEEVDELERFLSSGTPARSPAASPASRLKRVIAQLLPPSSRGAGYDVRAYSMAETTTRTYEAGGLTISLTVEADSSGSAQRWRLGLVVDEEGNDPPTGAIVSLRRNGEIVSDGPMDERGNMVLSGLESGTYLLDLELADRQIVVERLEVGLPPHP